MTIRNAEQRDKARPKTQAHFNDAPLTKKYRCSKAELMKVVKGQ